MVKSNKNALINSLEEENARLKKENDELRQMVVAQERMLSSTTTYLDQQRKQITEDKAIIEDQNFQLNKNLEKRNEELLKINARLEREIRNRKDSEKELSEVNQELNEFIYRTAHDLRTPATNLKGLFFLFENTDEPSEISELLNRAERSTDRLLHILKQLTAVLDIRNSQMSKNKIETSKFVSELFKQVEVPEKEKVAFVNRIDKGNEIVADAFLLESMIAPILENAVVYSRLQDSPRVSAYLETKQTHWALRVKDNGIGIPEESFNEVFKMFHRANHTWDGSGLGLYLAVNAANKCNAVIDFQSIPGNTEFSVIIPKSNGNVA